MGYHAYDATGLFFGYHGNRLGTSGNGICPNVWRLTRRGGVEGSRTGGGARRGWKEDETVTWEVAQAVGSEDGLRRGKRKASTFARNGTDIS